MDRYEAGMLAWSRAGHDKDRLYVIVRTQGEYAYLCDGRLRPLEKLKKKKLRHIQVIRQIPKELQETAVEEMKNEEIRKVIRRFSNV